MTILKGMIWTCHRNFLSMHNYVLACVRACVLCVWARVQLRSSRSL